MGAKAVREITGLAIGGVAPFGSLTPLATYCDADLLAFETVWASGGAPHAVFAVPRRALAAATGAQIIQLPQERPQTPPAPP